ncbi:MAG: Xaa-Pro peptidase family protein [Acidobacteriota bacterium]
MKAIPSASHRSRFVWLILIALTLAAPNYLFSSTQAQTDRLAGQPRADYKARRVRLMEQVKDGIIVLVGAREEDLGEVGRFRQKNDFMYLTGVETPAAFLILVPAGLTKENRYQETLFIPPRNPSKERWTGVQMGPGAEAEQRLGIMEVASSDTFYDRLHTMLSTLPFKSESAPAKLYTVVAHGTNALTVREREFTDRVKQMAPHAQIADVSGVIAEMRKIKSKDEIALLQKAIDITGEGQREAAAVIRPGAFEYEVQAALEYAFTRNGAERVGFPSIVGSGFYSTILHYNENRKKIEAGDTIVIDIGAEYSYYTADITRTYPATGKFTPRQRAVYQLVLDAQRAAERAYKPGVSLGQLQQAARDVMRRSPLRDRAGNTLDRYFIHGLGHWLGMDVHDVGNYGPLPVGAVFTIEPGIYIPDEKLGVRIEDDYLVTETGLVKMSAKIPSEIEDIERMMAGSKSAPASSRGNR